MSRHLFLRLEGRLLTTATAALWMATASTPAHAQFGGFLQGVLNAAAQQATAPQAAPQAAALTPAQSNAIAAAGNAIPITDPEYQSLMAQSLAAIPVQQRAALAPVIDVQIRQSIAARRLGVAQTPAAIAPNSTVNPVAQQALQSALAQGLAGRGNAYAPALAGDAGKAAAAGALIQGLGSLFNRAGESTTPPTSSGSNTPAP